MLKCYIIPLALAVSSCWSPNPAEQADRDRRNEEPGLLTAAQSVSLIFPLHYDDDEAPGGYTKVPATSARGTPERLLLSIVLCGESFAWVEKTSESSVVMIPSHDNAIWNKFSGSHPSDQEVIDCIRESGAQTFFYRKAPSGVETYPLH